MPLRVTPLMSGSSGNATVVSNGRATILIDCGGPISHIVARMAISRINPRDIDAIFLTHAHGDHSSAIGTFVRKWSREKKIQVFCHPQLSGGLKAKHPTISRQIVPVRPEGCGVKTMDLFPIELPHGTPSQEDPPVCYGWVVADAEDGTTYTHATDLGTITPSLVSAMRRSDCVLLEANYDEELIASRMGHPLFATKLSKYEWVASDLGHLSVQKFIVAVSEAQDAGRLDRIIAAHLSTNHQDPTDDCIYTSTDEIARGLLKVVEAMGQDRGRDVTLPAIDIAPRLGAQEQRPFTVEIKDRTRIVDVAG